MSGACQDLLRVRIPSIVDGVMFSCPTGGVDIGEPWIDATRRLVDFALTAKTLRRPALFVEYVAWLETGVRLATDLTGAN